jgi:ankyrin repeat protein
MLIRTGATALIYASSRGHEEIVKLLLARPEININHADKDVDTALTIALDKGHVEIVKLLLSRPEININHADNTGATALIYASSRWTYEEIVKVTTI